MTTTGVDAAATLSLLATLVMGIVLPVVRVLFTIEDATGAPLFCAAFVILLPEARFLPRRFGAATVGFVATMLLLVLFCVVVIRLTLFDIVLPIVVPAIEDDPAPPPPPPPFFSVV